jgi:hypothetical protein
MFASERSILARELRKPLPRPRDVQDVSWDVFPEQPAEFHSAKVRLWRPPLTVLPNPDFIPRLLRDFYNFCEEHPDRGRDPLLLAGIQLARDDCALASIDGEVSCLDFLTSTIFPSVTRALRHLEQNNGLRRTGHVTTAEHGGCEGIHILLQDGIGLESVTRAVFLAKSPRLGLGFFPKMDEMAQERVKFDPVDARRRIFQGAPSVIFTVSSYSCLYVL